MNEQNEEKNGRMNPTNDLTKALAAGAVAMFRPNRTDGPVYREDLTNAYIKLKEMIEEKYAQVDVDLLDIGPGSAERQELIARQLQDTGAVQDEEILSQARTLLTIIAAENPESLWASDPAEPPPQHK